MQMDMITELTGALALIGLLQLVVFGYQAYLLRKTVSASTDQSEQMKGSIAESARAAAAMERVAENIGQSVSISAQLLSASQKVALDQLRAYVAVEVNGAVYQDRGRGLRFEARPGMMNAGNTPARKLSYWVKAEILPFPIPEHFIFSLQHDPIIVSQVLNPRQVAVMTAIVSDFVDDTEVDSIKRSEGKRLAVWGVVTYEDAGGNARETKFCSTIWWAGSGENERWFSSFDPRHNEAS